MAIRKHQNSFTPLNAHEHLVAIHLLKMQFWNPDEQEDKYVLKYLNAS